MAEVINNDRLSVLAESTPLAMKELNQQKRLYVILGSVQGGILGDGLSVLGLAVKELKGELLDASQ